jgi:hypothetical protein
MAEDPRTLTFRSRGKGLTVVFDFCVQRERPEFEPLVSLAVLMVPMTAQRVAGPRDDLASLAPGPWPTR